MSTGEGAMAVHCGWEGNRRSGVALAMRHTVCVIYGLKGGGISWIPVSHFPLLHFTRSHILQSRIFGSFGLKKKSQLSRTLS